GRHGQFYGFRFAALLTITEAVNLLVKARELPDSEAKDKVELVAAGLALVGGSMEMIGSGGGWTRKHFSAASNTARIAKTWGGMMRLYGGFLGGAVGIVGAVFDGSSAIDAFSRRRDALGIAYAARMMVIGTATVMGATVAFAGSAPFLK